MTTELDKKLARISIDIEKLYTKVFYELNRKLVDASIDDIDDIINKVWIKYDVPVEYRNIILKGMLSAHELGIAVESTVAFHKFYEKSVYIDGDILSKKIQDVTRADEIASDIKAAMNDRIGIQKIAVDLVDKDITRAEIPKYVDDLIVKMRRATDLTGDQEAYMQYKKAVLKVRNRVESLSESESSKLAQGYRDIANLSLDASRELIDKTIERAVMFKARANAMRLAHTETARAYGNARVYDIQNDEDANAIQWTLNGVHDKYCVCDLFADADLYNMGPGVYPKDELPDYPAHPYCCCVLDPVYGEREPGEYDDENGQKFFDDLPEEDQKALVGKDGTWDDVNWDNHKLPANFDTVVEGE